MREQRKRDGGQERDFLELFLIRIATNECAKITSSHGCPYAYATLIREKFIRTIRDSSDKLKIVVLIDGWRLTTARMFYQMQSLKI